jgi:8-oxo-dGTP diphosphatase
MIHHDYISVTAAVIEKDRKVLIARRKRPFMGYFWEFPGGKLEDNETLHECLKREIREELAIEIEVGPLVSLNKHVLNCQSAIALYAYRARFISGNIELNDHEEIKWVLPEDLTKYDFPDPDRLIAKKVFSLLTNKSDSHNMDLKGGDIMTCGVKGCGTTKKATTKKATPKKATTKKTTKK